MVEFFGSLLAIVVSISVSIFLIVVVSAFILSTLDLDRKFKDWFHNKYFKNKDKE